MENLGSKDDGAEVVLIFGVLMLDHLVGLGHRARKLGCDAVRVLGAEELAEARLGHQEETHARLVGHLGHGVDRPRKHRRGFRTCAAVSHCFFSAAFLG